MANQRWRVVTAGMIMGGLTVGVSPRAGEKPTARALKAVNADEMARRLDEQIASRWAAEKLQPAAMADDAEFLRRVHLDIVGRIPSVAEVREFLDDTSAEKRRKLVDRLLESPAYVHHFTNVWRRLMLPESGTSFEAGFLATSFNIWLRKQLIENRPYDKMVREVLTLKLGPDSSQQIYRGNGDGTEPTPVSFYMAKEGKAENLAAATARVFLGIRLECAQCHNHPFAKWKREQFWELAAFFAGVQRQGEPNAFSPVSEAGDRTEMLIPETEKVVQANFLDGTEPAWKYKVGPRNTLADWVASPTNPFFAKAAVNRMWSHFFGVGIVDPCDDMEAENAASHPELLEDLAGQFAANGFDIKYLIRTITATKAYQLTSAGARAKSEAPSKNESEKEGGEISEAQLLARMNVKGLTAEQVYDSVVAATGFRDPSPANQRRFLAGASPRNDLTSKFSEQNEKRTESQTSILQALVLMNGGVTADATSLEKSETLAAVANSPFLTMAEQIETLYLATLSRKPRAAELERLVKYVEAGGPAKDRKKALADVFWVLLNSGEFILNH